MKYQRHITISGIVQGVGFRPFVYNLAQSLGILGRVQNDATGVVIWAIGSRIQLEQFQERLKLDAPPLAVVERIVAVEMPLTTSIERFEIGASGHSAEIKTLIAPDAATCEACLREFNDPADRRYHYPFINCTNCGPRFTIINAVPYDRPLTTMARFQMCAACQAEYDDPANRRFHAQPNACPDCGPVIEGIELDEAQTRLAAGEILAIKGLGGYHIACDARNEAAVQRLRQRKRREAKPFALMARDVETVREVCTLNSAEHAQLISVQRPIVLLSKRTEAAVSSMIAPQQNRLGMMLPYTPLHHQLLAGACDLLVMTSGNISGEPLVYEDSDTARLAHLADGVVGHNRPIFTPCDDSVLRVVDVNTTQFLRRSRGFAPRPIMLTQPFSQPILAVGGHLKNSFCLANGNNAFVSQHIGDLDSLPTLVFLRVAIERLSKLFNIKPAIVAYDLHPDYQSTRVAEGISAEYHIPVQHHHAHIASVMAEHNITTPLIGVAFDGSGYGTDGTVWGGEFLIADRAQFERVAHLERIPLLGGEQAVRQPWRVAAAWLQQQLGDEWLSLDIPFCRQVDQTQWKMLHQMMTRRLNSPLTSSMGRLFDAVAALLDVCQSTTYEGQAAIELEQLIDQPTQARYPISFTLPIIQTRPLLLGIVADLQAGLPRSQIAAKFHNTIVEMIVAVCQQLRKQTGLNLVALSGGVFQNAYLLKHSRTQLAAHHFQVYINERIPPNDGGLSLGQAIVADAAVRQGLSDC